MAHYIKLEDIVENIPVGKDNLNTLYAMATDYELSLGKEFYANAYLSCVDIANDYDLEPWQIVLTVALLSPRMDWENNIESARELVAYWHIGGYTPQIGDYSKYGGSLKLQRTKHTKADEVTLSDDPALVLSSSATKANVIKALWSLQGHIDVISGKKVTAFFANILLANPESTPIELASIERVTGSPWYDWKDAVTVDTHAINAWRLMHITGTFNAPESIKDIIRADYRAVARELGILSYQLQAVIWYVQKRLAKSRSMPTRE